MKLFLTLTIIMITACIASTTILLTSCAQIGMPTGGPKDSLPPKLVKATPLNGSLSVTNNKIILEFNEYIEIEDVQQNLIVSPLQNKNPIITSTPRSIIIKFKDTLLPNTTYSLNFGNAIKDVNEGNVYKNLSYVFATGTKLDSLSIIGKIILAETGGIDSTIMVYLYSKAVDSTVTKKKPNYIAKVDGEGNFEFTNLPNELFKIYALKDGDGGKTYNAPSELFAFADVDVAAAKNDEVTLYAYATFKEKEVSAIIKPKGKIKIEKKLKYSTTLSSKQDLLQPIEIVFNNPLKNFDSTHLFLTDTLFKKITDVSINIDSTRKKITISKNWQPDVALILRIDTLLADDSTGNKLTKNDTFRFFTKKTQDYGKVTLRFNGLNLNNKPVLLFLQGDEIKYNFPLTSIEWSNDLILPTDYTIRILYDTNNDGKWTAGDYYKKLQPEKSITLAQKLNIKADWDNEREINL